MMKDNTEENHTINDDNNSQPADRLRRLVDSFLAVNKEIESNIEQNQSILPDLDELDDCDRDTETVTDPTEKTVSAITEQGDYGSTILDSEESKERIINDPIKRGAEEGSGKSKITKKKSKSGCFIKSIILIVFGFVSIALLVFTFLIYKYFSIAATLPDINDLEGNASQFETTRILDRNGDLLYEILDPNAGRRTYVKLEDISPFLVATTIATEDKEFYNHPGFNPIAITRALAQNFISGGKGPGASTITQQLARNLLFTPVERTERTYKRKAREIILAAEITRKYSKDEILELYLNENYYGNYSYGVQAAAETYFNSSADQLSLAQSAFLVGLPQAPSVYDIYTNREDTLQRHKQVLLLTYELSQTRSCIEVSNNIHPVCVSSEEASQAAKEIEEYDFVPNYVRIKYPHWVNYIRTELEELYDPQTIYRSGFTVYTTLDPIMQNEAQDIVKQQIDLLEDKNVGNGALVAIDPHTGEIFSMVGSVDFYDEAISGQINMSVSPRQPGSSIKPLTYIAAFEKGWTPATLIWDVETEFPPSGQPDDLRPPYVPVNYDERYHGPVTVRDALANSYNIPAVKTLDYVGIYDDSQTIERDGFINFAERMGISTLTRDDYGLSLTLGGGDVSLLELTNAYAIVANNGQNVEVSGIARITDFEGNVIFEREKDAQEQLIRKEHAFLISSILSDNQARTPMFGANSLLNLPFPAAAKTGTTNDYRDNWTIGYTPDIVIGVWVGNADYTPMENTTGLTGAAPIWARFIQYAVDELFGGEHRSFARPDGVIEKTVCITSGTEPSPWCPEQRSEYFAYDQLPLTSEEDLWQQILVDSWTGLRISPYCSEFTDERFVMNVNDPWAKKWIEETDQGREWAKNIGFEEEVQYLPERLCTEHDPRPYLLFAGLNEGQNITENPLDLYVLAYATENFDGFSLEYGIGPDPDSWTPILSNIREQFEQPNLIYSWDVNTIPTGVITLKINMKSTENTFAEKKIKLNIMVPTVTPTMTTTFTVTPAQPIISETITPTLTETAIPTITKTP